MAETDTTQEDDKAAPPLTPSMMHGLLRAADSVMTRMLRLWEPPEVAELQAQLPQFRIERFLGRGGMGAVYEAWQDGVARAVAIKVLPAEVVDEEMGYHQRFQNEARAMALFTHPNIVSVFSAGETADGMLYIVMEYVAGTDVGQRLRAEGRLPADEAVRLAVEVCKALECAHAHGVIHRDIKPSNVMITADGTVKVTDFGLAKLEVPEAVLTRSYMAVGTPDFVAPESFVPGAVVDHRADIYATGVTLYQMLTGRLPRGRFRPPSGEVPGIPPDVDAVIDTALQSEPDKRYENAVAMRAALERVALSFGADGLVKRRNQRPKPIMALLIRWGAWLGIIAVAFGLGLWRGGASTDQMAGAGRSTTPVLVANMQAAALQGGRLRAWGHFKDNKLAEKLAATGDAHDFIRLTGDDEHLLALRVDGSLFGIDGSAVDKLVTFAKTGVTALGHGHFACYATGEEVYRAASATPMVRLQRSAALLAMSNDLLLARSADGQTEWWKFSGGKASAVNGPQALISDLADAAGSPWRMCFLGRDGRLAKWDTSRGMEASLGALPTDIVQMDCAGNLVVALRHSGEVLVVSTVPEMQPPGDLGPCVKVRVGANMAAAQRPDGTWVAWGWDQQVIDQVARVGRAIDLELDGWADAREPAPLRRYVAWIEPVEAGSVLAKEGSSVSIPSR